MKGEIKCAAYVSSWSYSCVDLVERLEEEGVTMPAKLIEVRVPFNWANDVYFDDVSFSAGEKTGERAC